MNTEPLDFSELAEHGVFDLRDPVETVGDLRTHDDPSGTARTVIDIHVTYIKEGPRWVPFAQPDANAPFPLSVVADAVTELGDVVREMEPAVDQLDQLADEPAQLE